MCTRTIGHGQPLLPVGTASTERIINTDKVLGGKTPVEVYTQKSTALVA